VPLSGPHINSRDDVTPAPRVFLSRFADSDRFAYLPLTAAFIVALSVASQLFARVGTKPVTPFRDDGQSLWPEVRAAMTSLR